VAHDARLDGLQDLHHHGTAADAERRTGREPLGGVVNGHRHHRNTCFDRQGKRPRLEVPLPAGGGYGPLGEDRQWPRAKAVGQEGQVANAPGRTTPVDCLEPEGPPGQPPQGAGQEVGCHDEAQVRNGDHQRRDVEQARVVGADQVGPSIGQPLGAGDINADSHEARRQPASGPEHRPAEPGPKKAGGHGGGYDDDQAEDERGAAQPGDPAVGRRWAR